MSGTKISGLGHSINVKDVDDLDQAPSFPNDQHKNSGT
jgi:hypothetical protein